jgi:hypothetical protein
MRIDLLLESCIEDLAKLWLLLISLSNVQYNAKSQTLDLRISLLPMDKQSGLLGITY